MCVSRKMSKSWKVCLSRGHLKLPYVGDFFTANSSDLTVIFISHIVKFCLIVISAELIRFNLHLFL